MQRIVDVDIAFGKDVQTFHAAPDFSIRTLGKLHRRNKKSMDDCGMRQHNEPTFDAEFQSEQEKPDIKLKTNIPLTAAIISCPRLRFKI